MYKSKTYTKNCYLQQLKKYIRCKSHCNRKIYITLNVLNSCQKQLETFRARPSTTKTITTKLQIRELRSNFNKLYIYYDNFLVKCNDNLLLECNDKFFLLLFKHFI